MGLWLFLRLASDTTTFADLQPRAGGSGPLERRFEPGHPDRRTKKWGSLMDVGPGTGVVITGPSVWPVSAPLGVRTAMFDTS
jgi:hypothetical protein